jgi:paraquat-inducible protein A
LIGPGSLQCARCGATLYRTTPHSLEVSLAFTVAAAVVFAVANSFPIMSLELQGRSNSETLIGMSAALQAAGMTSVAVLVFVTIVIMPAVKIAALLYILAPLAIARVPRHLALASWLLGLVKPWAMIEVLLLGALVSIGRLEKVAHLTLGIAFWSMAALMFLFAVIDSVFDSRKVWSRAEALLEARRA